jgi:hypothetical protein
MTVRGTFVLVMLGILLGGSVHVYARNHWAMYEREMQDPVNDPPDAEVPAEWSFARLRYPSGGGFRGGSYGRWGIDANKGDRLFIVALKRLSRIDARSIEQIVDVDSDEMFDWPFLYAVTANDWTLNEQQAARLGKFFERGGFLVTDDVHGDQEWGDFMYGVDQAMPGAMDEEIPPDDPIFHGTYDITDLSMIPGYNIYDRGSPYERGNSQTQRGAGWKAVRDKKGRIVVAGWLNQDLGDAWEFADHPEYPEDLSNRAFRFGVNYIVYTMTH